MRKAKTAPELLADGTLTAACLILKDRGLDSETVDCTALAEAVKATLNDHLSQIMAEWQDAIGANLGEGWLRELLNAQCNEMGLLSVEHYSQLVSM